MLNSRLNDIMKDSREKVDLTVTSQEFKRIREEIYAEEFLEALDQLTKIANKKSRYQIALET